MAADCLSVKRGPQPQPSLAVLPTKDLKDCSYVIANSMCVHVKSGSTIEASGDIVNLSNAAKIVGYSNNFSVVQDINAPAMVLRDCNVLQDSINKKESSDFVAMPSSYCKDSPNETPSISSDKPPNSSVLCTSFGDTCSTAVTNPKKCDNKVMPTGAIEEASSEIGSIKSLKQSSIEESQVGDSPKNNGDSNKSKQRITDIQSKLSSGLLATTERSSSGTANNRTELKVKKKLFKYQVASMQLSSSIIFSVAFCLQKKKHKRRKHQSLQIRSSNSKHLLCGNDLPSDLGPSVSDKSLPTPIDPCTYPQKKQAKRGSDNKELILQNISRNSIMSNVFINDECRERAVGIGTKQPLIEQSASLEPRDSEDYRSESRQAGTRGLEETTVTRWDGIDVSLSEKLEPRGAETVQIGYVGDEWDEEYDRGKRKKVRHNRISFGGPNGCILR